MSIDFSVIIPTYNRISNLKLVLASLQAQTFDDRKFEVIIADDGSTDGSREYYSRVNWEILNYLWLGEHTNFNSHIARNRGVAVARGKWIIFLDSDVVLNPEALSEHAKARAAFPDIVLIGMYHFSLQPAATMLPEDLKKDFNAIMQYVPSSLSKGPPTPGMDARLPSFHTDLDEKNIITEYDGLGFWGGNVSWPKQLFLDLGGYDENMPSGMGEDAELGQRMRVAKLPVLQYAPIYGVHVWHDRNWEESKRLVDNSIEFIDKKYSIGRYAPERLAAAESNYSLDVWYTKERGAVLLKVLDEPTVYASSPEGNYVGIPTPDWLGRLGFTGEDILLVDEDYFKGLNNRGVIKAWE